MVTHMVSLEFRVRWPFAKCNLQLAPEMASQLKAGSLSSSFKSKRTY